jgi:hypothetical protein
MTCELQQWHNCDIIVDIWHNDIPEYPPGNADIFSDVPSISFYINIYFKLSMNIKYPWVIFYDDIEVMVTKPTNKSYK